MAIDFYRPGRPAAAISARVTHALEVDSVAAWTGLLQDHFHIEHEVWGSIPGDPRRYRMDMLLHPRFAWPSGGRHPIGFEIKRTTRSVAGVTKAVGQASDYARATWSSDWASGPVEVFVAIFDDFTASDTSPRSRMLLERIAGRLNVALFQPDPRRGLVLSTSGERRWDLTGDVSGAAFSAVPKRGAR